MLMSASIEGIDYRGYASLDQGISVEGQVVYYFSNAAVCSYPFFENYCFLEPLFQLTSPQNTVSNPASHLEYINIT